MTRGTTAEWSSQQALGNGIYGRHGRQRESSIATLVTRQASLRARGGLMLGVTGRALIESESKRGDECGPLTF